MSYFKLQAPENPQYVSPAAAVTTQYPSQHSANSEINTPHFLPPGGEATAGGSSVFLAPQSGGLQTPSLVNTSTSHFLEFRDGDFYPPPARGPGGENNMGASGHSGDLPDSGELLRELLLQGD